MPTQTEQQRENTFAAAGQQPVPQAPQAPAPQTPATPSTLSPISTPVPATSIAPTSTLNLPQPTAPAAQSAYYDSVSGDVQNTQAALQAAYDKQSADIQSQLDTLKQQQQTYLDAENPENSPTYAQNQALTQTQIAAAQAASETLQSNFTSNQNLTTELNSLVQKAQGQLNAPVNGAVPDSLRTATYNSNLQDITARVGLIQAAMSAYTGQIGQAYTMIDNATTAINADNTDQLNYYNTLLSLNQNDQLTLTDEQKTNVANQISTLQQQAQDALTTADNIKQAMLDPSTAQAYAQAGVTLTDTPEEINQKLGNYAYSQELATTNNQMAQQGYTAVLPGQTAPAGAQIVTTTDSRGNTKQFYSTAIPSSGNSTEPIGNAQLGVVPQGVSTINALVGQGIIDGTQPPTITNSLSGNGFQVKAYLEANGYDLTSATEDWNAVTKWTQTEDSATVVKAQTAAEAVQPEIANLQSLLANWQSSNFPVLNSAELAAARSGALGENAKNLATQIQDQMVDLTSDMASVYRYGNSPTNSSMQQATNTLSQNWSNDQITAALNVLSKNVTYRINALGSTQNIVSASGDTGSDNTYIGGSGNSLQKGSMSDNDFVASAVQASGHDYSSIINAAPDGQIAVVENSSGTIGYIPVEEFDPSQYTRM